QIIVGGDVSLSGALALNIDGNLPDNSTFTIIKSEGTNLISGTFQGISQWSVVDAGGQKLLIDYMGGDGNDVVMTKLSGRQISVVTQQSGAIALFISPSIVVTLETSTNLIDWQAVPGAGFNGLLQIIHPSDTSDPQRFFRTVLKQ